jgi:hypothetical protein
MGYGYHEDGEEQALPETGMRCEIPFASGAVAVVEITVTGPDGEPRVPRVEEWGSIIKALATNQFNLSPKHDHA